MTRVRTREITGQALNWAAAKACNYEARIDRRMGLVDVIAPDVFTQYPFDFHYWHPATKKAQAEHIFSKEGIATFKCNPLRACKSDQWRSQKIGVSVDPQSGESLVFVETDGPTPWVAGLRCLVVDKLGEEIEVPLELLS